jgi:hypothetical protein
LTAKEKAEMDKPVTDEERFAKDYDAWEDLRNMRFNFFLGSWATRSSTSWVKTMSERPGEAGEKA